MAAYNAWDFNRAQTSKNDVPSSGSDIDRPTIDPCFMTAVQAIRYMKAGLLTAEEMARSTLERIRERDDDVRAWAYLNADLVIANAKILDSIPPEKRGPLHGIPIAVKDVLLTKDMPTSHGSTLYLNDAPKIDAGPIVTLRAAGALIFGKTTTTEFAASTRGYPSMNPYDPGYTPGGSSSGSGAAVGDYQCTLGLGTQTVGSTIRPGSYNGIYGMKPTWTSISREGMKLLAISLDTLGLYGRCAEDVELLCEVFRLEDDDKPVEKPLSEMKIGLLKSPVWTEGSSFPALEAAWSQAETLLTHAGVKLGTIDLDQPGWKELPTMTRAIMFTEARTAFLGDYVRTPVSLNPEFKAHVENAEGFSRADQLRAYDETARLRPLWDALAKDYDAVLTPSTPAGATFGLDTTGDPRFCAMWSGLHAPVINIPGFADQNGMPMGLSLVSGRYRDMNLLKVAGKIGPLFKGAHGGKLKVLPGVPAGL